MGKGQRQVLGQSHILRIVGAWMFMSVNLSGLAVYSR